MTNEKADSKSKPKYHKWVSRRMGGNPSDAESYEYVCFCDVCGDELTEENRNGPCRVENEP